MFTLEHFQVVRNWSMEQSLTK